MEWINVTEKLPKTLSRVWVETESGRKTTAYLKSDGQWFLFCRKIADTNPVIVRWRN